MKYKVHRTINLLENLRTLSRIKSLALDCYEVENFCNRNKIDLDHLLNILEGYKDLQILKLTT
jgi:hypothetical protein